MFLLSRQCARRQRLGAVLAALWLLCLLPGLCPVSRADSRPTPARPSHRAVCRCLRCSGGANCCCAAAQTPAQALVLAAACDQSAPTAWGRAISQPMLLTERLPLPNLETLPFSRSTDCAALPSRAISPPEQPPPPF